MEPPAPSERNCKRDGKAPSERCCEAGQRTKSQHQPLWETDEPLEAETKPRLRTAPISREQLAQINQGAPASERRNSFR